MIKRLSKKLTLATGAAVLAVAAVPILANAHVSIVDNIINFGHGNSKIHENGDLRIETDDTLWIGAPVITMVSNALQTNGALRIGNYSTGAWNGTQLYDDGALHIQGSGSTLFLDDAVTISGVLTGTTFTGNAGTATALAANPTDCGASTFATTIAANGNLTCAALTDASVPDALTIASTTEVGVTAADDGAGSFQGVWADVTLAQGATTGSYHGAIMGNVLGTAVDDTDSLVFGVLGKYSTDGANPTTEPAGGVIGEISGDPVTTTADGAVIALLGGDSGAATANAAFKVMGQNSTAGSGFTYGLDLFNTNTGAYLDNDQLIGTDIRLQNGETISNGTDGTIDFGGANLAQVSSAITRATGATGSYQSVSGDVTYEGAAGGTSTYHAGVMGNFMGNALTNANASFHAGVVGSYNVTTSDANVGAKAGVVGEVGDLAAGADAAFVAVLGGDSGSLTPRAAYGVQYFNSTASSKFSYGLDLSHAAAGGYNAVTYGVADIRLANGTTISSGATNPSTCVKGSLSMNTTDGKLYVCSATNTWTVVGTQT